VHRDDAEAHEDGRRADPPRRRRAGADREHRRADHDHADKERQQRRQDEIVDRKGNLLRQHADEVHRPDAQSKTDRRACEKRPLPSALGAGDPNREA
jgi:hypothetical protein